MHSLGTTNDLDLRPCFGARRIQKGDFNVSTSSGSINFVVLNLALLCSFGNAFQRGLFWIILELGKKSLTLGGQVAHNCFTMRRYAQGMVKGALETLPCKDGIKRLQLSCLESAWYFYAAYGFKNYSI